MLVPIAGAIPDFTTPRLAALRVVLVILQRTSPSDALILRPEPLGEVKE